jgi:molybdate transport system regulatory protein
MLNWFLPCLIIFVNTFLKFSLDKYAFVSILFVLIFVEGGTMEIKAKFWIENKGEVVLGGGKTHLLLTVDRLGSIQRAADDFGMSYRHAWGAIRKIEQRAGFKILDTKLGRKDGGAILTPKGKEFIGKVDSLLKDLQSIVQERFNQKLGELLSK